MALIEWLKSEIEARGTTQLEISRALGWSESTMSKFLHRHRNLRAEELVDVMRLLGWPVPMEDTPAARLVRAAAALAPDDLAHVTSLAERLARDLSLIHI